MAVSEQDVAATRAVILVSVRYGGPAFDIPRERGAPAQPSKERAVFGREIKRVKLVADPRRVGQGLVRGDDSLRDAGCVGGAVENARLLQFVSKISHNSVAAVVVDPYASRVPIG